MTDQNRPVSATAFSISSSWSKADAAGLVGDHVLAGPQRGDGDRAAAVRYGGGDDQVDPVPGDQLVGIVDDLDVRVALADSAAIAAVGSSVAIATNSAPAVISPAIWPWMCA